MIPGLWDQAPSQAPRLVWNLLRILSTSAPLPSSFACAHSLSLSKKKKKRKEKKKEEEEEGGGGGGSGGKVAKSSHAPLNA